MNSEPYEFTESAPVDFPIRDEVLLKRAKGKIEKRTWKKFATQGSWLCFSCRERRISVNKRLCRGCATVAAEASTLAQAAPTELSQQGPDCPAERPILDLRSTSPACGSASAERNPSQANSEPLAA